jgi:isopenicillin N synthase-like dioxygenase
VCFAKSLLLNTHINSFIITSHITHTVTQIILDTMTTKNSSIKIPTIKIQDNKPVQEEGQVKLLRETCELVGFFYLQVQDDGLKNLLDRVFHQSKQFFALPANVKKQFSDPVMTRGYTAMGEETLDPSHQMKGDTKEGYYLAEDVSREDPRYNPDKFTGPNIYPTNIQGQLDGIRWKETMMEYHEKMKNVCFQVIQLLALALDLPKTYFDPHFRDPLAFIRLLHYSNEVSDVDRGIFACGAHSDYGMLTVLAMDKPGLQIHHDGRWIDVPVPPEIVGTATFVVNLGDMLERWTNGKFKSTVHRVLISSEGNDNCDGKCGGAPDSSTDRYSIPFFYDPNFDTVVECIESCLGDEGPKYPPIVFGRHLIDKYKETHADFVQPK